MSTIPWLIPNTTKTVVFGTAKRLRIFTSKISLVNMSVLAMRLRDARLRAGISQEKLGIEAGLDEMSASTRMNRYELGKRIPNPELVERFGKILGVPASYFYAVDNGEAELLLTFNQLDLQGQHQVIDLTKKLVESRRK